MATQVKAIDANSFWAHTAWLTDANAFRRPRRPGTCAQQNSAWLKCSTLVSCALLLLSLQRRQEIIIINANKAMVGTDKWLICWIWSRWEVREGYVCFSCSLISLQSLSNPFGEVVIYSFLPTYVALDEGLPVTAGIRVKGWHRMLAAWHIQPNG